MTDQLRPYQQEALDRLRASLKKGAKAPILVMPTGSGKTVVAKAIVQGAISKSNKVLFLAPRRELVYQCSEKLSRAGVYHGVLMAGERPTPMAMVQVACVPTLHSRAMVRNRYPLPDAALVVIDEVQYAGNDTTSAILAAYPDAIKIGLSATPARKSGKSLGELFDDMVMGPTVQRLTDEGYLVPVRYYVPSSPDLKGVKVQAGDYNERQLGERMDNQTIIGDVLTNWLRVARDRKTVIFTVNVSHSLNIEKAFKEAGVSVAHLDANTPVEERKRILAALHSGEVQVVTQCDILSYGWDEPSVSCIVLARPTKSLVRYLQTAGRGLRPFPGKKDCIVLDHGNCVAEHGLVTDEHAWSLDQHTTVRERDKAQQPERKPAKDIVCPACSFVFRRSGVCPACGAQLPAHHAKSIGTVDDDLAELKEQRRVKREWSPQEKQRFYRELLGYAQEKKYQHGWAAWKFKEKFGTFPRGMTDVSPLPAQAEVMAYVKYLNIRDAKRKQKQHYQQVGQ